MDNPFLPPDMPLGLTQAILARTSGSTCQRLKDLACAYVDGALEVGQQSLGRGHLEICPSCAALVKALALSETTLPSLVHLNPGPWFTQRVLRATVHRTEQPSLWWKLMHRPRIALEAAYLGAAAGLMGSYLPLPMPHLTARVPAMVQPLGASVQRVVGQVVQAERRTSNTLQRGLVPKPAPMARVPSRSLWQRLTARIRSRLQAFHKAPSQPKAGEKSPKPGNP